MSALYVSLPSLPFLFDVVDPAGPTVNLITSSIRPSWGAVSPDNTILANVSDGAADNGVELWSLPTMSLLTCMAAADRARGVGWSPDSQRFYVQGLSSVLAYTRNGLTMPSSPWGATGPAQGFGNCIAVSPDNTKVYACSIDHVSQYDAITGATLKTWTMTQPCSLALSPDGSKLYVTDNLGPCKLFVIDTTTGGGAVGAGVPLGQPYAGLQATITPDGSKLYVAAVDRVLVVNTTTFAISAVGIGIGAYQTVLTPDALTLWVTDQGNKRIVPIDTPSGAAGVAINVDDQPLGIATVPPLAPVPTTSAITIGPVALILSGIISGTGGGGGPGTGTVTGTATLMAGPVILTVPTWFVALRLAGTAFLGLGPLRLFLIGGRTGPGAWPVPGYRGRWRLTLHQRKFAPATLMSTIIAELTEARGRQLVQAWNTPATLTFTLDGQSDAAQLIGELVHDVVAWRWDDQTGTDIPVFRGIVAQSEDQLTTEAHVVTFTCHDYAAMLDRRMITDIPYTVTGRDQDIIVGDLLNQAVNTTTDVAGLTSFSPASFLPLSFYAAHPDGSLRGLSGRHRDRTYYGSQNIGAALADLAAVINGFDYDVQPTAVDATDRLRIFYPQQGVTRTGIALQYGSTVASLTRTVSSADYANYIRVLGNSGSSDPTHQLYAEQWTVEAQAAAPTVGLWMLDDNASDVTVLSTLNDKALGDLNLDAVLVPHYTLVLTPGAYSWGNPNMGDTVPLIVQSGRLNVNTSVRVLGIVYSIGDDGQEDVALTVSRPKNSLYRMFKDIDRNIKALDRR